MDHQYFENLLQAVLAAYQEDLAWHEKHWAELDDFMRTEFLTVDLPDAARRLSILQAAVSSGELSPELIERLRLAEEIVSAAASRLQILRRSMNGRHE